MAIRLNITTKLILLLLPLSLLPIIVLGNLVYSRGKSIIISQKGELLKNTASSTIDKLDSILTRALDDVKSWTRAGEMEENALTDDADNRIQQMLENIKAENRIFTRIVCFNIKGNIIASTDRGLIGVELPDDYGFKTAIEGKSTMSDVSYSMLEGGLFISISCPIESDVLAELTGKKAIGVISAYLNWQSVSETINSVRIDDRAVRPTAYPALINRYGLVLSVPDFAPEKGAPLKMDLTKTGLESVEKVLQGKDGYLIEKKQDKDFLIGYAHSRNASGIENLEWSMLVMQDMDEVMIPVIMLQRYIISVGFIEFLVILMATIFFSQRVSAPIIKLTVAAKQIAEGKDIKVSIKSEDEIEELANSFNTMVSHLKESKEEIEAYADNLEDKQAQLEASKAELKTKLDELERFHRFIIDRELRMVELKEELKRLKEVK